VYFRRNHRDEMSGLGGVLKLIAAPWIGFLAQIFVLLLAYHNLYFLASLAGNVYVGPRFELFAGTNAELQFNLLGIIGVLVPLIGLAWALTIRSTNPAKYELMGHFVNEGGA
jgi:hypothetical protein